MKTGTLPPVSNAETWQEIIQLYDDSDGVAWDIAEIAELTIKVRDPVSGSTILEGSLTGGELVQVGPDADGTYQLTFTDDAMSGVDPKTYEVGLLATNDDGHTKQLILGWLPVLNGL